MKSSLRISFQDNLWLEKELKDTKMCVAISDDQTLKGRVIQELTLNLLYQESKIL